MIVIGITGPKRHGKGETGNFVCELANERAFKRCRALGFADKLKVAGARALGFIEQGEEECIALMDEAKENWFFDVLVKQPTPKHTDAFPAMGLKRIHKLTGRQYLQWFGTEVGRELFGDTFWIDQVLPNTARYDEEDKSDRYDELVDPLYPGIDLLAITDVRFANEAQRVKDYGGFMLEVIRPQLVESNADDHASEQGLPRELVDTTIINDGTLADLRWRTEQALEVLGVIG